MIKVSPYPVDHRHEIIAYGLHSGFSEICQTYLIVRNEPVPVRTCVLDSLAYREAFHYRPPESITFDIVAKVFNCVQSPYFSVRYFM